MSDPRLVTTSTEGLQPLGSAALRSWELLTGVLRARLGEDHAALFAEPVPSAHGDSIDWYAPMVGDAVPLADLSRAEQQALRARLGRMVAAIRAEADQLRASAAADDQRLAEALLNALEIPGEEMIFAVRDGQGGLHPVLVHWAWSRGDRAVARGVLSRMEPRPTHPAGGAPGEDGGARHGWLRGVLVAGWVLLALMLAAILYLLIAPCGVNPAGPLFCPAESAALAAAYSETGALDDRIAALEREIALADRACQPVIPLRPAAQAGDKGGSE